MLHTEVQKSRMRTRSSGQFNGAGQIPATLLSRCSSKYRIGQLGQTAKRHRPRKEIDWHSHPVYHQRSAAKRDTTSRLFPSIFPRPMALPLSLRSILGFCFYAKTIPRWTPTRFYSVQAKTGADTPRCAYSFRFHLRAEKTIAVTQAHHVMYLPHIIRLSLSPATTSISPDGNTSTSVSSHETK